MSIYKWQMFLKRHEYCLLIIFNDSVHHILWTVIVFHYTSRSLQSQLFCCCCWISRGNFLQEKLWIIIRSSTYYTGDTCQRWQEVCQFFAYVSHSYCINLTNDVTPGSWSPPTIPFYHTMQMLVLFPCVNSTLEACFVMYGLPTLVCWAADDSYRAALCAHIQGFLLFKERSRSDII